MKRIASFIIILVVLFSLTMTAYALSYRDPLTGSTLAFPEGWEKEDDSYLVDPWQALFCAPDDSEEFFVSISDFWEEVPDFKNNGISRAELTSELFTIEDIRGIFSSEDYNNLTVVQQFINGNKFFIVDLDDEISYEDITIPMHVKVAVLIDNGYYYMLRSNLYDDANDDNFFAIIRSLDTGNSKSASTSTAPEATKTSSSKTLRNTIADMSWWEYALLIGAVFLGRIIASFSIVVPQICVNFGIPFAKEIETQTGIGTSVIRKRLRGTVILWFVINTIALFVLYKFVPLVYALAYALGAVLVLLQIGKTRINQANIEDFWKVNSTVFNAEDKEIVRDYIMSKGYYLDTEDADRTVVPETNVTYPITADSVQMPQKRKNICPYCGAITSENAKFCHNCGKSLLASSRSITEKSIQQELIDYVDSRGYTKSVDDYINKTILPAFPIVDYDKAKAVLGVIHMAGVDKARALDKYNDLVKSWIEKDKKTGELNDARDVAFFDGLLNANHVLSDRELSEIKKIHDAWDKELIYKITGRM